MDDKAQFKVIPNGPLQVSGNFELFDASGKKLDTQAPIFLCRCGKSAIKPYCDGAHKSAGFTG